MPNYTEVIANYVVGLVFFVSFFIPLFLYLWYSKRGGKNSLMMLLAIIPWILLAVGIVAPFFLIVAFVYGVFAPFISYLIYVRLGGEKKWLVWFVIVPFLCAVIKAFVSMVMA